MKKAIVIGASSGIGWSLAEILANQGYLVGITGRRQQNLEGLQKSNPSQYIISSYDCSTENNSIKLTELTEELGGLDLLVLSSGTGDLNDPLDFDIENRTTQLNVVAFTEIVGWAYRYFENQGFGHVVAITSIGGLRGSRLAPAYNASKAYQINYLEGLRQKANRSKKQIYITDIRPGFVDTDMAKGDGQFWVASKEKVAKQIYSTIERKQGYGYRTKRWVIFALLRKVMPSWFYTKF
jgi:short-subunit dehydrogenase